VLLQNEPNFPALVIRNRQKAKMNERTQQLTANTAACTAGGLAAGAFPASSVVSTPPPDAQ
jgi:hypothetical protein